MSPSWEEEAKWIWTPDWRPEDEVGVGKFVYYRKTFELERGVHACAIRISADSRYRLWVNGVPVSRGPCKGDRFTWYYDSVEIGNLLREGVNILAVQVLRYPYLGGGNQSVWRTRLPGLYVHADIIDEKGVCTARVHSDESWICLKDESIQLSQGVYTQFLGIAETVDAARKPIGWMDACFDSAAWIHVVAYEFDIQHGGLKPWELSERPIPALYETERRFNQVSRILYSDVELELWQRLIREDSPVGIPPRTIAVVDLDAGELTTGYLALSMSRGKGTVIRLLCAECYEREPVLVPWLRDKGDRTDSVNGELYGDEDVYKVSGDGTLSPLSPEIYEPFWFRTFRYVRLVIETGEEPFDLIGFGYRETGYPLDVAASYRSSDPEEDLLWDISVRTLRRCMHETYEDCPYYEQLQYVMDTRSQILFTYSLSGDDRLARKTFYDFHSSLLPQGLTQSRYPSDEAQVIPGFSLYWIFMLHDHMMFAGDRDLIARYLPSVDAILGYFHRMRDDRGLVGRMNPRYWSFVDWADRWKESYGVPDAAKKGPSTVYCLMYAYALQQAAELAYFAGRHGLAEEYEGRAEQMRQAVRENCRSELHFGCFTDGPGSEEFSQHSQIWAILSGTSTGDEARRIMEIALTDDAFVPCSFAMSFYLFRALSMTGLYNQVYELFAPWRQMAKDNLTTWMEDTVSQRSDAHAWGSVPVYEYLAETLGVLPIAPGYGEIEIQPRIGRLHQAQGRVMTSHGPVDIHWHLEGERFHLSAKWPEQVPCVIRLPNGRRTRVETGGAFSVSVLLSN
ncbi:alpha-L-rhamnosidase C-terminal domain-containing protein [Cohnella thailandensis]|uniref:Alpha-L-rhamnosidase N-terminal domain-containing protein n=1 Tax=Cohnella thailandensis TaxID=557557 RepID=A0A841SQC8_9BACL|nr:alpha-L-rhamnosidase C-terminal domain-containing protein [Cohnella thailandensis]MBB6634613.1 alpha-L-rhamnosidase N-terminal domain-containing protein [Cohnella thailandensis]MBP1972831.1 hypothetical protein [Cohnella thailandensis]